MVDDCIVDKLLIEFGIARETTVSSLSWLLIKLNSAFNLCVIARLGSKTRIWLKFGSGSKMLKYKDQHIKITA